MARYGKTPLSLSLRRHSHGLASLSLFALGVIYLWIACPTILCQSTQAGSALMENLYLKEDTLETVCMSVRIIGSVVGTLGWLFVAVYCVLHYGLGPCMSQQQERVVWLRKLQR